MTKNHFFPVFYRAWNETFAKPQNVVSGFRSKGLLPFNEGYIDFYKLIDSNTDENFRVEKACLESPITIKVCLMRALTIIVEKELDGHTLELFDTRFKNGYDEVVDIDPESLCCIYSNLRRSLEENAPSQVAEKNTTAELSKVH